MPPEQIEESPIKRDYPRALLSIRIQYQDPDKRLKEAFTGIMGGGGLFIDTLSPLPVGTAVSLDFSLPGEGNSLQVDGQVVWVRPEFDQKGYSPGMAVQFKEIEEQARERILELVMRILTGRPEDSL